MRFELFIIVTMLMLFWVAIMCGLVGRYKLEEHSASIFSTKVKWMGRGQFI
jgi:hypothetical protein